MEGGSKSGAVKVNGNMCQRGRLERVYGENEEGTSETDLVGRNLARSSQSLCVCCLPEDVTVAFLCVRPLTRHAARERDHGCLLSVKAFKLKGLNYKFILAILTFLSILT